MPTLQPDSNVREGLTYFNTRREPTILEIDAAAQYESYSTDVVLLDSSNEPVYTVECDDDPRLAYRFAVIVRVFPAAEKFMITLKPGAGAEDLAYGQRVLQQIREGRFNQFPWAEHPSKRHPGASYFGISLGEVVRVDGEPRAPFEACVDPACFESMHVRYDVDEEPMHVADSSLDGCVQVIRFGGAWSVSLNVSNDGDLTPEDAVSLANDLRWAAATCAKLNGPKAVA